SSRHARPCNIDLSTVVAGNRWRIIDLLRRNLALWNCKGGACTHDMKRFPWLGHSLARCEFAVAILLTLVLIVFHFLFFFHAGPLWRDEISSLSLATEPTFSEFWQSLTFDPFPASYFLVLRLWHAIGLAQGDLALRGLGLVIGLALIGSLWLPRALGPQTPPA